MTQILTTDWLGYAAYLEHKHNAKVEPRDNGFEIEIETETPIADLKREFQKSEEGKYNRILTALGNARRAHQNKP